MRREKERGDVKGFAMTVDEENVVTKWEQPTEFYRTINEKACNAVIGLTAEILSWWVGTRMLSMNP